MVGPDYKGTMPDAPLKWHTDISHESKERDVSRLRANWWKLLNDPLLTKFERQAVKGNFDLKSALEKIREERALYGVSSSKLFPYITGNASGSKSRSSENAGLGKEANLFIAGLDAGWELDLFGGIRRKKEAAIADLEAAKYSMDGVMVSMAAEVGLNYVDIRTFQARLKYAKMNLAVQQHTFDLNQSRYGAGLVDELAVQQSLYNLEHTRSLIPQLENGLSVSMNRLAVLLGEKPGTLEKELSEVRPVPSVPLGVAIGIPAEVLRHRPDVKQAERELAAATARIGIAEADLYPKFNLTGSIGLRSVMMKDLLKWGSRTFNIGPSISWNIFDANGIRRNVDAQVARQHQALIHYKSIVLKALEEVENALTAFSKEQQRRKMLELAVKAAARANTMALDRFKAGLIDFSNVLDTQRSLMSFQDELASSTGAVTSDFIRLYKALGGGWSIDSK